ncbi:hypothetical protein U1Q18_028307, partial [Sarracenia purpurea var. burkii]
FLNHRDSVRELGGVRFLPRSRNPVRVAPFSLFLSAVSIPVPNLDPNCIHAVNVVNNLASTRLDGDKSFRVGENGVRSDCDPIVFHEKPKPYPCNKQKATILPTPMPSGDFDSKAASNLLGDLCLLGDREKQEGVNGKLSACARKMDDGLPQPCVEDKGFATEEEWSKKGVKKCAKTKLFYCQCCTFLIILKLN